MLMLKILHAFGAAAADDRACAYTAQLPVELARAATASADDLAHRLHASADGLNREAIALSRQDHGSNVCDRAQASALRKHLARATFTLQASFGQTAGAYLKRLLDGTARVARRSLGAGELPASELVVGDTVRLEAGDMVPADLRLVACNNLSLNESALAGRRVVAHKSAARLLAEPDIADAENLAFAGTVVANGSATGVVVAVGARTLISRIAAGRPAKAGAAAPAARAAKRGAAAAVRVTKQGAATVQLTQRDTVAATHPAETAQPARAAAQPA